MQSDKQESNNFFLIVEDELPQLILCFKTDITHENL